MLGKTAVSVSAVLTLGALAGPGLRDDDDDDDDGGRHVIELVATCTAINDFVDVGPVGPSPGDIYVYVDELFTPDLSVKVGTATGSCNLVDPASGSCAGTFVLEFPDGTITISGILYNVPGVTSVGAITGSTGRYRGVSGEATVELGSICGPHEVTLILTR